MRDMLKPRIDLKLVVAMLCLGLVEVWIGRFQSFSDASIYTISINMHMHA
jgi:hypothetical protein